MYFDLEDYRPDITPVGQVISWREGILLSIIAHMAGIILLLLAPQLFPFLSSTEVAAVTPALDREKPEDKARFVFVDPKVDLEALRAPRRAPPSDKNREARSPEPARIPNNPLPASRGNSPERVERVEPEVARGQGPGPEPAVEQRAELNTPSPPDPNPSIAQPRVPESQSAAVIPTPRAGSSGRIVGGGSLGDALRNLERYTRNEQFDNQGGGTEFGNFQFDTKGVEFGPWIRRFAQQVRRNWDPLIPKGPMMMRQTGRVVVTLNIHKNGSITDVKVVSPCPIEGFNSAAYGALVSSHPTQPLPPEYPADKAFFTITFYYNERPPD